MFQLLDLELVEALAVDTDDIGLGDESLGIDVVDDTEDDVALAALGHDEEHLHLVSGVEAVSLDDGGTTMWEDGDARRYLLIFIGDDEELYRPVHDVDDLVDTIGSDEEDDISVDDLLEVMQDKVRGGDDEDVAEHDDSPQ